MTGAVAVDHRSITSLQALPKLDTNKMFGGPMATQTSPLDQFITNTNSINVIYLSAGKQADAALVMTPELGALALLGYMSAVESYFRAVIRGLIVLDECVNSIAEPMNVSYAAAVHHSPEMLPEALTEHLSFAGEKNVTTMLREILGIKGAFPLPVDQAIKEFVKICEIRHCCVHRFGRLGSKTAIALGMATHNTLLEQPFAPTVEDLQNIADLLRTFVKIMNNFIFHSVIERVNEKNSDKYQYSWQWTWDEEEDMPRFQKYYDLFASKEDTTPSPAAKDLYASLEAHVFAKSQPKRKNKTAKVGPQTEPVAEPALAHDEADAPKSA